MEAKHRRRKRDCCLERDNKCTIGLLKALLGAMLVLQDLVRSHRSPSLVQISDSRQGPRSEGLGIFSRESRVQQLSKNHHKSLAYGTVFLIPVD